MLSCVVVKDESQSQSGAKRKEKRICIVRKKEMQPSPAVQRTGERRVIRTIIFYS
jgi:hypothetical protein